MMEPLPCHEVNISKVKMGWVTMTTLISSTTSCFSHKLKTFPSALAGVLFRKCLDPKTVH